MAVSRLFVVLLMFAVVKLSYGSNDESCVEPAESNLKHRVCINLTPRHKELQMNMTAELQNNQGLVSFKENVTEFDDDTDSVDIGDDTNCRAYTTMETPYMIHDTNTSDFHYLVQTPTFQQKIKVTRCLTLNAPCLETLYSHDNDNNVEQPCCREKTGYVSVYVYNPKENKIVYKPFELPVCCACMIRKRSYK